MIRINPTTGASTPFATGFTFSYFAFDGDVTFSADGNTMYVASSNDLLIITAALEPSAVALTLFGGVLAVARGRLSPPAAAAS